MAGSNDKELIIKIGAENTASGAFKQMQDDAVKSAQGIEAAYKRLGVTSTAELNKQKAAVSAAYQQIKNSGTASAADVRKAWIASRQELERLDGKLTQTGQGFESTTASLGTQVKGLALQFAGIGTALSLASDAFNRIMTNTQLETRIKRVVGGGEAFAETNTYLSETANKLNADLLGLKESYAGYLVQVEAGMITTAQARQLTEGFAQAAAALGISQNQLGQANYGLSQALASGIIVRAEEFNQVFEATPGLLQAVERANGLASGSLRKLVNDGKVTSEMFINYLIPGLESFDGTAQAMAGSSIASMTRLNNAWTELALQFSDGTNSVMVPAIGALTDVLKTLTFAVDKVNGLFGQSIADQKELAAINAATEQSFRSLAEAKKALGEDDAGIAAAIEQGNKNIELGKERIELEKELKKAKEFVAKTEAENIKKLKKENLAYLNDVIKGTEQYSSSRISSIKLSTDEWIAIEKAATEQIKSIHDNLADTLNSIDDQIRANRRKTMTEAGQQADIEAEINEKFALAQEKLASGDTKGAEQLAKTIRSLSGSLKDVEKGNSFLEKLKGTIASISAAQIEEANNVKEAAETMRFYNEDSQTEVKVKADLDDAKTAIVELEAALQALEKPRTINVKVEIDQAAKAKVEEDVFSISDALATLYKFAPPGVGNIISSLTKKTGDVLGFAKGGSIPGFGGGDRIPALLEAGEYIVNKQAAAAFRPLLDRMNFGGPLRFANGGSVPGGAPVNLGQFTWNINNNGSKRSGTLLGERNSVNALLATLGELS